MKASAFSLLSTFLLASTVYAAGNVSDGVAADALAAPPPESLVVGAIQSLAVDHCALAFSLQVTADAGGGTDLFRLEVYDEQRLLRSAALSVPADGAVHTVAGTIGLPPISQATPGIGVVLADGSVLDIEDPVPASCAPFEVPAVSPAGLAGLAALLLSAGVLVLRRRGARS